MTCTPRRLYGFDNGPKITISAHQYDLINMIRHFQRVYSQIDSDVSLYFAAALPLVKLLSRRGAIWVTQLLARLLR